MGELHKLIWSLSRCVPCFWALLSIGLQQVQSPALSLNIQDGLAIRGYFLDDQMCTNIQAKIIVNHTCLYSPDDALIVRNIIYRDSLRVNLLKVTKHPRLKCYTEYIRYFCGTLSSVFPHKFVNILHQNFDRGSLGNHKDKNTC